MSNISNEIKQVINNIDNKNKGNELSWFNSDFSSIDIFLNEKLSDSLNYADLLDILNLIIKYTNNTNIDWLDDQQFISNKKFISNFISNMKYFRFNEHIYTIFRKLEIVYGSNLYTKEFIDEYFRCGFECYRQIIYSGLSIDNAKYFIKKLVECNIDVLKWYDSHIFLDDDYMDSILQNCSNIFEFREKVKNNERLLKYINDYIDKNERKYVDSMVRSILHDTNDDINELVYLIVLDICKNENIKISDTIKCGKGLYSTVIKIGNKVLKIGDKRVNAKFPNNPYIIKPLLRKSISFEGISVFIEVTELVDNEKWVSSNTYDFYKKLRNLGLVWIDIKSANLGYLLKDNEIYWRDEINPSDETLNLDEKRGEDIHLKKGELVLLDADGIIDESSLGDMYNNLYEQKFQNELNRVLGEIRKEKIDIDSDDFKYIVNLMGFREDYIIKKLKEEDKSTPKLKMNILNEEII